MRAILVAAMAVLLVASGAPAFAGGITNDEELREHRQQRSREDAGAAEQSATRDVVVEEYHSAGAEFGIALGATALSILYHPARMILGVVGAELGGFGGWATGGDQRTAKGLWRPTVEGDYFVRADHLDGTETFDVVNTTPVFHGRYTVREVRATTAPAAAYDPDRPSDLESEDLSEQDTHERAVEEHATELTTPPPYDDDSR